MLNTGIATLVANAPRTLWRGLLPVLAAIGLTVSAFEATADGAANRYWTGTHYTKPAGCYPSGEFMTTRYDTTWSFQAPVIFATRNDAATYQRVGWRPRVVAQDPNGQFRTIGTGPWQYAWAYDTHPAAFTTQQMFVPRATSASAFASPEFVVIDTQFFSTTRGQLAVQDLDWA
jgi:hypothetical protein